MDFKTVDMKPMNINTLQGLFSLTAGPLKIEGFTYHVKGDKSWIGFPSKEYIDKETGEKKYWPMVRIEDKDRYYSFQNWCKDQVSEIFDHNTETQPHNDNEIPF